MLDWLMGLGGTLPHLHGTSTNFGNFSAPTPAEDRTFGAAAYVPTSHVSPYTYSGAHATHHHDHHPHIHNETHYHIITYINGTVNPVNYTHTHPHYPGHQHQPYHNYNQGAGLGLTGALSSWYQLNMGLIGIGALAVVAIIGSRNFFANYLTIKKYPYGDEGYGGYDMYGSGYGGGGGYNRRSWYDEWYKYWYGDSNIDPNDPYKNGGPGKRTPDPYGNDHASSHRNRDESNWYHKRYRRSSRDSANQPSSDNSTEAGSALDSGQENGTEYDSLNLPEGFDEMDDTASALDLVPEGGNLFEYVLDAQEDPSSSDEEDLSVTHCGFRLICELSRQRKRELTKDEWEILRLIKFSDLRMSTFPPGEGILSNHAALSAYKMAGRVGSSGYPCHTLRGMCPLQEDQINGAAKQFFQIEQNKLKKKSTR